MLKGFIYALNGIREAFSTQVNFRIHFFFAFLATGAGWYFNISKTEWLVIIILCGMVFCAELFNTAIEYLVDLLHPAKGVKAGQVKDIAAGAVLVTAITAVIAGICIFLPKING